MITHLKLSGLTFLSLFLLSAVAQDTVITYYDKNWYTCTEDGAMYYRKKYVDANKITHGDDYYMSGRIQETGTYVNKSYKKEHGAFVGYYENGQKEYTGNYVKGKKVGEWIWWSDSGMVTDQEVYNEKGLLHGPAASWYANGQPDFEGNYVNDEMDGVWKFYHANGQQSSLETYQNGTLVALEIWNEAGVAEKPDGLYAEVEPVFPGGEAAMITFIQKNVVYPEEARSQLIQGTVYIQFVVGSTGELEQITVLRSVHPLLDEEALRVINLMPAWSPGKQHNRAIRVRYQIPIKFNIT